MRIGNRQMPFSAFFMSLAVANLSSLVAAEYPEQPTGTTTLVILASDSFKGRCSNEFIVLRAEGQKITWSATAVTKATPSGGQLDGSAGDLRRAFDRVSSVKNESKKVAQQPMDAESPFYTLLLIDHASVRTTVALGRAQQDELRTELRSVFDAILKAGVYGKANIMLELFLAPDAQRAVTRGPK